jgi:phosphonoacetaldehyde hydrolase
MTSPSQRGLAAVIFDWAGTMIDFGSRAPVEAVMEIFRRRGVNVPERIARAPMGMAKRDHIDIVLRDPAVVPLWRAATGRDPAPADVDSLYTEFLPLQLEILRNHGDLIPGAAEAAAECRRRGLKIGSTTGYTAELMQIVMAEAARQGYAPDVMICSSDVSPGRPAPWMIFEVARRLNVYPMSRIVKVDDTPVGIEAGRNAGTLTVGIVMTGNEIGLTKKDLDALPTREHNALRTRARKNLKAAGAHHLIDSVADLAPILTRIEKALRRGLKP